MPNIDAKLLENINQLFLRLGGYMELISSTHPELLGIEEIIELQNQARINKNMILAAMQEMHDDLE